ncbi:hypothetical protein CXB77_04860 [Chromatium okenii]|uniref:Uncharacterized protein n=1 Tax=Chromatium okenii TaxID=61644 RepID=A0A2S7XT81_9GAMM|nr:hypothetical protein CXB77_04860 [Chromatium okenii]
MDDRAWAFVGFGATVAILCQVVIQRGLSFLKPLTRNMLNGLAINHNIACKVNNYLCGKISGDELKTALTSVSVGSDSVDDGAE